MTNQIEALKTMAIKNYETDGGVMAETFGATDYADLIEYCGTADAAWAMHLRITEARRESGGFYESF